MKCTKSNIIQYENIQLNPKSTQKNLPFFCFEQKENLLHHLDQHPIDPSVLNSLINLRNSTSDSRLLFPQVHIPSSRFNAESMSDEFVERSSVPEVG